jgi:hypothetical protein
LLFIFFSESGVAQTISSLTTVWTTWVRSPAEPKDFSSTFYIQTGSEANLASYPIVTGGKARPGRDADRSSPFSAEVPLGACMAVAGQL